MAEAQYVPFGRWCESCEQFVSSHHKRVMAIAGKSGQHQPVLLFSRTGRTYRGGKP